MSPLITPHEATQVESGVRRWQELRSAYAGPNTSWDTLRFLQDGSPPPERTRTYYTFTPEDPTPRPLHAFGRTAPRKSLRRWDDESERQAAGECEPLTRRERWQIGLPTAVGLVLWGVALYQVWRWLA